MADVGKVEYAPDYKSKRPIPPIRNPDQGHINEFERAVIDAARAFHNHDMDISNQKVAEQRLREALDALIEFESRQ